MKLFWKIVAMHIFIILFFLVIFAAKSSAMPGSPMHPDANWKAMNPNFMDGTIQSQVWVKNILYVSGNFSHIAGIEANSIAAWDGNVWKPLGIGVNGGIEAMISDVAGNIYAGGAFDSAGGQPALNIAQWNGQNWSALGKGVSGNVWDLVIDKNGNVYAGGVFNKAGDDTTAKNIACWNGSAWSNLKTGGHIRIFQGTWGVYCLAVDSSNNIYMGGYAYTGTYCTMCTSPFAKMWNSVGWDNVYSAEGGESGFTWPVLSIAVDHKGAVYLTGADFRMRGPQDTGWTVIKKGWSRRILGIDDSNNVFIEKDTQFTRNSEYITYNITEKWNGATMSSFGDSGSDIHSLSFDPVGNMYACGDFKQIGGAAAQNIAMRDKQKWVAVIPGGIDSVVYRCAVSGRGVLHITGAFTSIVGNPAIDTIAQWDGSGWKPLPGGPSPGQSLFAAGFDSFGNIYLDFNHNTIKKWGGMMWTEIARVPGQIQSMAVGADNTLYICGSFDSIYSPGGEKYAASRVARWDGKTWTSMGQGLASEVKCIAVGPSGEVYVVEWMYADTGHYIKKWSNASWSTIGVYAGKEAHFYLSDLIVDRSGAVYFCADVDSIGGLPGSYGKWDGQNWTILNSRKRVVYYGQTTDDAGNVYVAGKFDSIGDIAAEQIARWNGRQWAAIGSGATRRDIRGIAFDDVHQCLYVCGGFKYVGNTYSPYLAAYDFSKVNPVLRPLTRRSAAPAPRYRLIKTTLVISDITSHDAVTLYSFSGRLVKQARGYSKIDLSGRAPGPMFVRVTRAGKVVSAGIVMMQ